MFIENTLYDRTYANPFNKIINNIYMIWAPLDLINWEIEGLSGGIQIIREF